MIDGFERTEGGQPVYRHAPRETDFEFAAGDEENIAAITEHIEANIGSVDSVWHEIISDLVHVDLHLVRATDERPYHVVVTSGMSDRPMTVPPGLDEPGNDFRFAELAIGLPPNWKLGEKDLSDERWYWPLRLLKSIARLPHEYGTWLGVGHSIPNGDPADPYDASTRMDGVILMPPFFPGTPGQEADGFATLEREGQPPVHFYGLLPVYPEEMDFKIKHTDGAWGLFERLDTDQVIPLNPQRKTAVPTSPKWMFWKR